MSESNIERTEMRVEPGKIASILAGKRIVVTGAAGSVGSALCAEIARMGCAHLTMLDQFDHGLLEIVETVRRIAPRLDATDALCDVRDLDRVRTWMRRSEADIVIHAAALKHVHLGERHPGECIHTNLIAARNVLLAAHECGVADFVLISSDKAAAPGCVMGATKRLLELHLPSFAEEYKSAMRIRAVRFGNVLGSQGSVLPRFEAQIRAGGPIEVTHPAMERYFMSSAQAVALILKVAALLNAARKPEVFFMEMGAPINILQLGLDLIRQAGKSIDVVFTGLRPGEKLNERLVDEFERSSETHLAGIHRVVPLNPRAHVTSDDISYLSIVARSTMDAAVVRQRVFELLDERLGRTELAAG